jgi:multiple sugar transport system substrate-binding protein
VIYYRRDWLARAGVDEENAFGSAAQVDETLAKLLASGVAQPWAVPTLPTLNTLHNAISWVWGAGGDCVSADGRLVLFHKPEAIAGWRAYFDLHRYLAPQNRRLRAGDSNVLFRRGEVGAILSGPWTLHSLLMGETQPDVKANFGVALPPGDSFVGGSHLIVWKHSHQARLALELIQHLTSHTSQTASMQLAPDLLPGRYDALDASPLAQHPGYHLLSAGVRFGRSFPAVPRWGLVEDKLAAALNEVWADVLAQPAVDLDALLHRKLDPPAKRLEYTLQQ